MNGQQNKNPAFVSGQSHSPARLGIRIVFLLIEREESERMFCAGPYDNPDAARDDLPMYDLEPGDRWFIVTPIEIGTAT
jgi:hypothetical protein